MSSTYKIRVLSNECGGFKKARLQISVGQPYHEGEKFMAAAVWVAANFDQPYVNLCDTLQRHNFMFHGVSPFDAYDRAVAAGDAWLERNKKALDLLKPRITRWEQWKEKEDWQACLSRTKDMYENDDKFRATVKMASAEFWARKQDLYPTDRKEDFLRSSRQYLLEEVAVSLVMTQKDVAEIYPGTFPKPLYYMRDTGLLPGLSMTPVAFIRKQKKNPANSDSVSDRKEIDKRGIIS